MAIKLQITFLMTFKKSFQDTWIADNDVNNVAFDNVFDAA